MRDIDSSFFVSYSSLILPYTHQLQLWDNETPNARWYDETYDIIYQRLTEPFACFYIIIQQRQQNTNYVCMWIYIISYDQESLHPCSISLEKKRIVWCSQESVHWKVLDHHHHLSYSVICNWNVLVKRGSIRISHYKTIYLQSFLLYGNTISVLCTMVFWRKLW